MKSHSIENKSMAEIKIKTIQKVNDYIDDTNSDINDMINQLNHFEVNIDGPSDNLIRCKSPFKLTKKFK